MDISRSNYKILCFYCPTDFVEKVNQALFDAGAGKLGDYEHCAWMSEGKGQFRPLKNADPYLGKIGETFVGKETKVEMIFESSLTDKIIETLLSAHPYEEVGHYIISPN